MIEFQVPRFTPASFSHWGMFDTAAPARGHMIDLGLIGVSGEYVSVFDIDGRFFETRMCAADKSKDIPYHREKHDLTLLAMRFPEFDWTKMEFLDDCTSYS